MKRKGCMSFDKNKIMQEFKLKKFGARGYYGSKEFKCPECGRFEKFGINFEYNKVHCFYDEFRSNIEFFLKKINRRDLLSGEDASISFEFPSFNDDTKVIDEETVLSIKKLPIGFKRIKNDEYLNGRNFLSEHYEMFQVGETKIDPSLKNHLIFQFFNKNGDRIAWMSRSRNSKEWHKNNLERFKSGQCDLILRYGNSPNTDFSKILGGENEIDDSIRILIVVEGIMDKVGVDSKLELFESSGMRCVFTFGNKISEDQMKIINKYKNISTIFLLYDYNTIKESKHNGLMMMNNLNCKDIRVCEIKQKDKDPGDLIASEIIHTLQESVNGFSFFYSKLDGIEY